MPVRITKNVNLSVHTYHLEAGKEEIEGKGGIQSRMPYTYSMPNGDSICIRGSNEVWVDEAIEKAKVVEGIPYLSMPFVVLMKLRGRTRDWGDVGEILKYNTESHDLVRSVV
jgi:hypothetical protein